MTVKKKGGIRTWFDNFAQGHPPPECLLFHFQNKSKSNFQSLKNKMSLNFDLIKLYEPWFNDLIAKWINKWILKSQTFLFAEIAMLFFSFLVSPLLSECKSTSVSRPILGQALLLPLPWNDDQSQERCQCLLCFWIIVSILIDSYCRCDRGQYFWLGRQWTVSCVCPNHQVQSPSDFRNW